MTRVEELGHSVVHNLPNHLSGNQNLILACLDSLAVPCNNCLPVCAMRLIKARQKASNYFPSVVGTNAFYRIRFYPSPLRKQGLPVLEALERDLISWG